MTPQRFRSSSVRDALAQARETLGPVGPRARHASRAGFGLAGVAGRPRGRSLGIFVPEGCRKHDDRPVTTRRTPHAPTRAVAQGPVTDSLVARLIATGLDRDLAESVVEAIPQARRRDVSQGQFAAGTGDVVSRRLAARDRGARRGQRVHRSARRRQDDDDRQDRRAGPGARGARRFRLVAADGYRVGAVEQFRLYADIIGSPFVVARTPEEVDGGGRGQPAAGPGRHARPLAGQRGSGRVLRGAGGLARRAHAPGGAGQRPRPATSTASGNASRWPAPTGS